MADLRTTPPPASFHDAITKDVMATIGTLSPEANGGLVATATIGANGKPTYNFAVIHKIGDHFEIAGWVAANKWGPPLEGGGMVRAEW